MPTCLQRNCPKANIVPCWRRRSRPTSIARSKTTSEAVVAIRFFLLESVFTPTQALSVGDQTDFSYRQSVSRLSRRVDGNTHLCGIYQKTRDSEISDSLNKWCDEVLTHCGFGMQRWCSMHISQAPREFYSYPRWRFYEATVTHVRSLCGIKSAP